MVWDAFKSWLRGENITRIAMKKRQSIQSIRQLEEQAKQRETTYVLSPDQTNYISWQLILRDVCLLRIDLTKKSMLDGTQRGFEFRDKNVRLLA